MNCHPKFLLTIYTNSFRQKDCVNSEKSLQYVLQKKDSSSSSSSREGAKSKVTVLKEESADTIGRPDSWSDVVIDNQIAGQDKAEVGHRRESRKNVQENVVKRENLREFSSWRAAIWPLTGPLGSWGARGTRPVCRPRGLDDLSRTPSRVRTDPRRSLSHARHDPKSARHGSDHAYFLRGVSRPASWLASQNAQRTYIPSCRLIFRLKSHTPKLRGPLRDCSLCETRLPGRQLARALQRRFNHSGHDTGKTSIVKQKICR